MTHTRSSAVSRLAGRSSSCPPPTSRSSISTGKRSARRTPTSSTTTRSSTGHLDPESVDTHELVWEQYVGESLRTSVSTYFYKASRLITLVVLDRLQFDRRARIHESGHGQRERPRARSRSAPEERRSAGRRATRCSRPTDEDLRRPSPTLRGTWPSCS